MVGHLSGSRNRPGSWESGLIWAHRLGFSKTTDLRGFSENLGNKSENLGNLRPGAGVGMSGEHFMCTLHGVQMTTGPSNGRLLILKNP